MALKLDITKAFDKVSWPYLNYLLQKFGFAENWTKWIMECVTTTSYSVMINGIQGNRIVPQCGIRQGDPLSPYLYILCTEGLSYLIKRAEEDRSLTGYKAAPSAPPITHLLFADDSLVFCKASVQEAKKLKEVMQQYADISGQRINFSKSSVVFSNPIDQQLKQDISAEICIPHHRSLGLYVGLPEFKGRSIISCFQYLLDKMDSRVQSWSNKLLNPAGKEVMIKSVLQSLPTFAMQCFLLPKQLLKRLEQKIRSFWWQCSKDRKPTAWVKWSKINAPKSRGGLGFRNLELFNKALLAKQCWRIITRPYLLVSKVFKAKYFNKHTLFTAPEKKSISLAWRSIKATISLIKDHSGMQVGPGSGINIWNDKWVPGLPPKAPKPKMSQVRSSLHTPAQLMQEFTREWDADKVKEAIHPDNVQEVLNTKPLQYSRKDKLIWPYTASGQYSAKSGYDLLYREQQRTSASSSSQPQLLHKLCKSLWSFSLTPKIKMFWWKVMNKGLPTQASLYTRGADLDPMCPLCGEAAETIDHLITFCRVSLEIWSLIIPTSHATRHLSTLDHINHLWKNEKGSTSPLSAFVGWSIWKAQNDLIFKNEPFIAPHVIRRASEDHYLWHMTVNNSPTGENQSLPSTSLPPSTSTDQDPTHRCYVNASWVNNSTRIGICGAFMIKNVCFSKEQVLSHQLHRLAKQKPQPS